mmetsp:Transcript_23530/g.55762  ORF Transcript_23530/g.55762 Transcript_23530/m.55762 type:complete len:210 (+) Transcript_23530:1693-2322(+)
MPFCKTSRASLNRRCFTSKVANALNTRPSSFVVAADTAVRSCFWECFLFWCFRPLDCIPCWWSSSQIDANRLAVSTSAASVVLYRLARSLALRRDCPAAADEENPRDDEESPAWIRPSSRASARFARLEVGEITIALRKKSRAFRSSRKWRSSSHAAARYTSTRSFWFGRCLGPLRRTLSPASVAQVYSILSMWCWYRSLASVWFPAAM